MRRNCGCESRSDVSRRDQTCVFGGETIPAGERYSLSFVGTACLDHAHERDMVVIDARRQVELALNGAPTDNLTALVRKKAKRVLAGKRAYFNSLPKGE